MAYIKFRNSKDFVKCLIEPKENIVSLAFPLGDAVSTNTSGFDAFLDAKGELLIGEYGAYTTAVSYTHLWQRTCSRMQK